MWHVIICTNQYIGIYIDTSNTLMSLSISLGIVSVIGILYIVLFSDLKLKNDAV